MGQLSGGLRVVAVFFRTRKDELQETKHDGSGAQEGSQNHEPSALACDGTMDPEKCRLNSCRPKRKQCDREEQIPQPHGKMRRTTGKT